jgi:hypothetical protein
MIKMSLMHTNIFLRNKDDLSIDADILTDNVPTLNLFAGSIQLTLFFMDQEASIETMEEMIKCLENLKSQLLQSNTSAPPLTPSTECPLSSGVS